MLIPEAHLAVENLALRQQVAAFKHSVKRPTLRTRDRIYWVLLSRLWPNWRTALAIVQPGTVIKWSLHRMLTDYFDYGHNSRPQLSLDRNSPSPRNVEPRSQG